MDFLRKRMAKRVRELYPLKLRITPNNEMALYNRKCHLNAIEAVNIGKATGVVECVVICDENEPILHYINIDAEGNYIDYTLGRQFLSFDYHYVRLIKETDYDNIWNIFRKAKFNLVSTVTPRFITKLLPTNDLC